MYGKCSKISNTLKKTLVIRTATHKMIVRKTNREDPDQIRLLLKKQSDLSWVRPVGDPKMRKGLLFAQRAPFREKDFYFC